jgi:hypothetical protein
MGGHASRRDGGRNSPPVRSLEGPGISLNASELGIIGGKAASVSLNWSPPAPDTPTDGSNTYLSVILNPTAASQRPEIYAPIFSTRMKVDPATTPHAGRISFEGLAPEPMGESGASPAEPISGSITWTCD